MGIALLPSLLHFMKNRQPWGARAEVFLTASYAVSSSVSCCWRSCTCMCVIHRATTYYLADRRYDMLPSILSADVCSLLGGVDRWVCSLFLSSELVLALASGLFRLFFLICPTAPSPPHAFPLHPLHPLPTYLGTALFLTFRSPPLLVSVYFPSV